MQAEVKRPRGLPLLVRHARDLVPGWYPVALAKNIGTKLVSVVLGEVPYVLYRDAGGAVVALLDRCPHRNVPLSEGRLVDGLLECPYHGWKFATSGECVAIPGRTEAPKAGHAATCIKVQTHGGIVFVAHGDTQAPGPPLFETHTNAIYTHLTRQVEFPAGLFSVIENALDVPHTSILHKGLFRGGSRNVVRVVVRRYQTHVEAQYIGEPPPQGLLARLLTSGSKQELIVDHWDRFHLPGVLQVEYRLGPRAHIVISGYACPRSEHATTLFAMVSLKTPLPRLVEKFLVRVVEPFAQLVLKQDIRILKLQSDNLQRFGEARPISTELDVLYAPMTRLLKEAEQRLSTSPNTAQNDHDAPEETTEVTMET